MLLIHCPFCGPRAETEFHCGGEAHIIRPEDPSELSDEAFCDYLFHRTSTKGVHAERWVHNGGCGRWFNALRDTVTDRFIMIYPMGDPRPDPNAAPAQLSTGRSDDAVDDGGTP